MTVFLLSNNDGTKNYTNMRVFSSKQTALNSVNKIKDKFITMVYFIKRPGKTEKIIEIVKKIT